VLCFGLLTGLEGKKKEKKKEKEKNEASSEPVPVNQ
jgi:hypothetical protein